MNNFDSKFWDERFFVKEYIYGIEPNPFFKEHIDKLIPGKILLLGEGEGRNAIYGAQKGWKVDAVDYSGVAKNKAMELAKKSGVNINYRVQPIQSYNPIENYYDAIAIIFLHLNEQDRSILHYKIFDALDFGGTVILEVFDKDQLGKTSGGPQNINMLYSLNEIKNDFRTLQEIYLKKEIVNLDEGDKHTGKASVVSYVGRKLK
ncbi:MAG: methyltransferase domain-containing protein [Ignavibacteria bacterium]|nr:methyltransferase domain-containing protein [Ignavibacteria bacterium]